MKFICKTILLLLIVAGIYSSSCSLNAGKKKNIQLLILSGSNNHDWKATTPLLESIFLKSGYFDVHVTNRPDTLTLPALESYDVVVSNWNSWPDNKIRWPEEAENGWLKYLEEGGGMVFVHAASSVFYEWPAFKKISTGAWIDKTRHGPISSVHVEIENTGHPITDGMADFHISDELWIDAELNTNFKVLGRAIDADAMEKGIEKQPAILVSDFGKGRIFHTILGHDTSAMLNTGFQTLIIRGTEWAATSKVSFPVPGR